MSKKKKLLFHSDFSLAKTGFGRNAKDLLTYLYHTDKYEIVHYCCGINFGNPVLKKTPWRSVGCLPDNPKELELLNRDPQQQKLAGYGALNLDKVINDEKPDVYMAVQDFWGVDFSIEKKWFNKIPCVLWITLDSLPILPPAIEKASSIKNYWVWSKFAEKELHRLGHNHVKTVHGCINENYFYRLSGEERKNLRNKFQIPEDAFVTGFVFRNQLRKSVGSLIEGYKKFKTQNPSVKNTYLLLHTSYAEGWDINRFLKEYGVSKSEVLTTYICYNCNNYEVKSHQGEKIQCPYCQCKDSQQTTNVAKGVLEEQLNEVYNLMDVYCHPFTSGGQEIPIQEAKFTELITLVTNYSCGEELCEEGSGSFPLEWSEAREINTQFIKAATSSFSIAKQLTKVYNMDLAKRTKLGQQARKWTLENYSVGAVGKKVEEFLDGVQKIVCDEDFVPDDSLDDKEWLVEAYCNILNKESGDERFEKLFNSLK